MHRTVAYPFSKNFFQSTFDQYVTVWLARIWVYKNADKKEHAFSWKRKKRKKTDKRGRKTDTA